jgi:hypothetical protein
MSKLLSLGLAGILAVVLVSAAFTKPSREALHDAAATYADKETFVGSVATRLTAVFGNDSYDDYIFFGRYRVYVGKHPKLECYGAFGRTICTMPRIEEQSGS